VNQGDGVVVIETLEVGDKEEEIEVEGEKLREAVRDRLVDILTEKPTLRLEVGEGE
jgi:hypothetical protein